MAFDLTVLKKEINEVRQRHTAYSPDEAFVFWSMLAFLTDDEALADGALVGGKGDKAADAIIVDHPNRTVLVIQGKYRTTAKPRAEKRADLLAFALLGERLVGTPAELKDLLADANALVRDRLLTAQTLLRRRRYDLSLYYVTTGSVSGGLRREVTMYVHNCDGEFHFIPLDRSQVFTLGADYLTGAAPPVPTADLIIDTTGDSQGAIRRVDKVRGIESWVFSVRGSDIGALFRRSGSRLFARNIRGFLGERTDVNHNMQHTLAICPDNFWYFNNGITIVCDPASRLDEHGESVLHVTNPQIINGQQTTRILSEHAGRRSSVLVRVIKIPRDDGSTGKGKFERLVGDIVLATNWQNRIRQSDLRANDHEQVRIDRELRRLRYCYLRKRESKQETRARAAAKAKFQVKKEEIAKAVAACEIDSSLGRTQTEGLFDEANYGRVFDGRPIDRYLTVLWLARLTRKIGWGDRKKAYARWLVTRFAWDTLKKDFGRGAARRAFINACERDAGQASLRHLRQFLICVFAAAHAFYKRQTAGEKEPVDFQNFFKRSKLDTAFGQFWRSQKNTVRKRAKLNLKRHRAEAMKAEER